MNPGERECGVPSHERGAERLRESDVGRIVGSDVAAQLPDPGQQDVMGIARQRQVRQVHEGLPPAAGLELSGQGITAEDLRDFEIENVRRMEALSGLEKPFGNARRGRCVEQDLQDRRGVDDDQRASRSALTAFAGARRGTTAVRSAIRWRSSAGVGRSATRRASWRR
jgi:hypothetical protein